MSISLVRGIPKSDFFYDVGILFLIGWVAQVNHGINAYSYIFIAFGIGLSYMHDYFKQKADIVSADLEAHKMLLKIMKLDNGVEKVKDGVKHHEMIHEGVNYKGSVEEIVALKKSLSVREKPVRVQAEDFIPQKKRYRRSKRRHAITLDDKQFILVNMDKMTHRRMAKKIGCSISGVYYVIQQIKQQRIKIAQVGAQIKEEKASLL